MRHIHVVGPPGSGKTTISKALSARLSLPIIHSGDVAREMAQRDSSVRMALSSGRMAPPSKMDFHFLRSVKSLRIRHIIDGYPRYLQQLMDLVVLADGIEVVVIVNCRREVCLARMQERQRDDEDLYPKLWRTWYEQTRPMEEWLQTRSPFSIVMVNGTNTIQEIVDHLVVSIGDMVEEETVAGSLHWNEDIEDYI